MTESKQVIAPRSAESIRLAMLAGHNADLGEALHALTLAGHMAESKDPRELNLVSPLVIQATIAYGRCFTTSSVREKLSTIVAVPEQHKAAHESLMKLRNSTVAHSESTLTPTFAVVNLERDVSVPDAAGADSTVRVTAALALTSHPAFSIEAIEEFHLLVSAVRKVLFVEIEDAKAALVAHLASEDLEGLWDEGLQPEFLPISHEEWDIRSRRPDYPESNVIRVVVPAAQTKRTILMPSSGNLFKARDTAGDS